ncbi:L-idonate 5-dehydrogenase [Marivivens sp. LCG002]|uniref:L-idonate 5-dehydrogenase n=1 Tax=Marivivens sp. LCG002 TaxID=3051171 RepID=UPI002556121E|nr:L-idonate 5-dehydrogenase [Marivivens sp. LCG002]WIV50395.1 L-idonate 5-dehydrogenase [Marivivens sp. LCG002]
MKALYVHGKHDLRLTEIETEAPAAGEVQVTLARGGICGSDLHYFNHGGINAIRIREPMILGHEVSGVVSAIGEGVTNLKEGDLVAVSPSRPCGNCEECHRGLPNQCLNMRFYGSAMPFPHIQGAFRETLTAMASQCVKADGISAAEAAMAEPLAVALHGARRAGELLGRRVLVTGCGPIGLLCILAARRAGAGEIIATDVSDGVIPFAKAAGADVVINTLKDPEGLAPYTAGKGTIDVMFEASGVEPALRGGMATLRPRGRIVQLGLSNDMSLPMVMITAKELELVGSFRFHEEFAVAVRMMQQGLIDVKPLVTHSFALADYEAAFAVASDRSQAMKVQLEFA